MNSLAYVLRLLLVLIPLIFFQMENVTQVSASLPLSSLEGTAGEPVAHLLLSGPSQVVAAASTGDGCDHPFVSGQLSWECHHPMTSFLLSSSLFVQALVLSESMVNNLFFPDPPFSRNFFSPASSNISPLDHPPRAS